MNKELQISTLKRIFKRLNPDVDERVIDWEAEVDETLSLTENRKNLADKYPQYKWFEEEVELEKVFEEEKEHVRREAERLGIIEEEVSRAIKERENMFLWDKFSTILSLENIDAEEYRKRFNEVMLETAGLDFNNKQRAIVELAKEIIKEREKPVELRPKREIKYFMEEYVPEKYVDFFRAWMENYRKLVRT